jgi:hypothetical protein
MISRKSLILVTAAGLITTLCYQIGHAAGKTKVVKTATVKRHLPDSKSVVFSSQRIDLSDFDFTDPSTPKTFSVNVIFGKAVIVVNAKTKLRININPSFFASVKLPDGITISSSDDGSALYEANLEDAHGNPVKPEFFINANATFGSIVVIAVE